MIYKQTITIPNNAKPILTCLLVVGSGCVLSCKLVIGLGSNKEMSMATTNKKAKM